MKTAVKVRSPKGGYDNDEKQKYRIKVWSILYKECKKYLIDQNAKVLLLPSKEGIEIDVAISFGIRADQIIAIDENPALIAVSSWRKKHPDVIYFGCKVSQVHTKIKKKGWYLAAANLDFCNSFSQELVYEINEFLKHTPRSYDFPFFVTFAKGREGKALLMMLKRAGAEYNLRYDRSSALLHMIESLHPNIKMSMCLLHEDQYTSSRVPMIFLGLKIYPSRVHSALKIHLRERYFETRWYKVLHNNVNNYRGKNWNNNKEKYYRITQELSDRSYKKGIRQREECAKMNKKYNFIDRKFIDWYMDILRNNTAYNEYLSYDTDSLDAAMERLFT
jgi:hypothetical protein